MDLLCTWSKCLFKSKIVVFLIFEPYVSLSCTCWSRYFLMILESFSMLSTMPTHGQACICLSKYTTARVGRNLNIFFWITKRNLFKSEKVFQFLIERLFKQSLQSKTNGGDILEWELNWWQISPTFQIQIEWLSSLHRHTNPSMLQ